MVAMAILGAALTWLVLGVSRNITAENHAKLMTTASFLVRGKMIELEDELYQKGFGEFEKEDSGNFADKGFARFSWRIVVDKVELPSVEQLQTVLTNAQQARQTLQGGSDPHAAALGNNGDSSSGNPLSASAGAIANQFGIIKDVLEQGIRRVTVKVGWLEGRTPREVALVTYYTDVRRVDQAIQLTVPAGQAGAAGATTTPTSGSASGSGSGH
jgi:hypothetical protein